MHGIESRAHMRHISTYNEAAQGPGFRRVGMDEINRQVQAIVPNHFSPGEVEKMIKKAEELGWEGSLREMEVNYTSIFGIRVMGTLLRITELGSGRKDRRKGRMPANQVCLRVDGDVNFLSFSGNIMKSDDDYFFVEVEYYLTRRFMRQWDGDRRLYYVCDGIEGVLELMGSLGRV